MLDLEKAKKQALERIIRDRTEDDKIYIHLSDLVFEAVRQHARVMIEYRKMLKRLEWASVAFSTLPVMKWACPICCCFKEEGHAEDCELAALLKKHRN